MIPPAALAALAGLVAALFRCWADPDAAIRGRLPMNPWLVNSLAGLLGGLLAVFAVETPTGVVVGGLLFGYVASDVVDSLVYIVWRWLRG